MKPLQRVSSAVVSNVWFSIWQRNTRNKMKFLEKEVNEIYNFKCHEWLRMHLRASGGLAPTAPAASDEHLWCPVAIFSLGTSQIQVWIRPWTYSPRWGTQVQKWAAPSLRISRKKGSFFKTSACPRFCKRRVLFCTQIRSMGVKIPLQSTKYTRLWRRVTPEMTQGLRVFCRHLLPLNKQRIIES